MNKYALKIINKYKNEIVINTYSVAKELGFDIYKINYKSKNNIAGFYFNDNNKKCICINENSSIFNNRIAIAFLISIYLIDNTQTENCLLELSNGLYSFAKSKNKNDILNKYALALLIPYEKLITLYYQNNITDLMELSHIFLVDYSLMYHRLKDLGIL